MPDTYLLQKFSFLYYADRFHGIAKKKKLQEWLVNYGSITRDRGSQYASFFWGMHKVRDDLQLQTRHNSVGEIRIFSVKICINPYPSFMHQCIAKTFTRDTYHDAVCQKNHDIV